MPLKMTPLAGVSPERLTALQNYLNDKFWQSVTSRQNQVSGMYQRWMDNYNGKPLESIRTTPFYKASNFVPQLIRMHTDISAARIIGLLFATHPFWRVKSFNGQIDHTILDAVSSWMDDTTLNGMDFYEPIDMTMFLTFKCGVTVLKQLWEKDEQYVSDENGKVVPILNEGCGFDVVPFDDFFPYPVTARNLSLTIGRFHRLRFAKEEVEYRRSIKAWDERACDLLLRGGDNKPSGNPRESSATSAGISLTTDVTRPFTVVEGHVSYQLEPGKMYKLIVTFNPYSRTKDGILRAVYDYTPRGMGVFTDFRAMPREDLFYGYSVPEILEQAQEEKAQIHNARRDANTITNVPGWKKKRLADVGNPSQEWYPGKVFELDQMDDLEPLTINPTAQGSLEEEASLNAEAEQYTGISPAMQGFGSGPMGKKGVYASQATLALLTEGNKRLDIYLRRMRQPFHRVGTQIFTSNRDYKSSPQDWKQYGENGEFLQQAFALSKQAKSSNFFFGLSASDAGANREVDRQNLLLMANTMSAYYKQIMELVPMVLQAPPQSPAHQLGLQVLDGARDLANRLLFAFDVPNRQKLVPDLRELLGEKQPPRSPTADDVGLPPSEEPISEQGLQDLSGAVDQVQGGLAAQNGGRPNGQPGRVV